MRSLLLAVLFGGLTLFGGAGSWLHGQIILNNDSVLLLTEDFTGGLGTGPGEVTWAGSGGFAAVGGDRSVRIGDSTAIIDWDAPNFIGSGRTLILGDPNADGTLIWDNAINLGFTNRSIRVVHGTGNTTRADARFDRALRGNFLTIEGNGRLDITANNPNLRQAILIYGAELRLNDKGKFGGLRSIQIYNGGTLTLDNAGTSDSATGGQYSADRLLDNGSIRLEAGSFRYIGQTEAGDSVERLALIDLYLGSSTIDIINNRLGFVTEVRVGRLRQMSPGATLNFISSSGVSRFGDGATLRVEQALADFGGILPYATVSGEDWASLGLANSDGRPIVAYFGYNTGAQDSWGPTTNASPIADQVLSGSRNINSLRLTDGRQVDLSGRTLLVSASALLSVGAADTTIHSGTLNLLNQAYVHVYNTGASGLTISSRIIGRGLTKTGPGHLTLSGAVSNQIIGSIYVNEGLLILNKSAGVAAIHQASAGRIEIGDRRHSATLRLDKSEQISNSMNVWLRGGFADTARYVGQEVEGVLHFNGAGGAGLTETFRELVVLGRGVVDFQGGTLASPNWLILDDLKVFHSEGSSVLLVRNWVDLEDRLLVRRSGGDLAASLPYIHFEGYAPGAITRDYDAQFWEVVPAPEASTCGAVFGAVGLGLWARRRRQLKGI
ncbi:hypothetical protein [Cephaloticoccus capnophilus]|nr:hypothetical protein [Cephaloticoccus capnophilus]